MSLLAQGCDISDSPLAEALAAEEADLDLRLVQPASMFGCVVDRESVPQPASGLLAEPFHQRLAGVRGKVVHDQVDGIGCGIADGDLQQVIGELGGAAHRRHLGEVPSRPGLDAAKYVGGSASLVFVIAPATRHHARTWGRQETTC